MHAIEKILARNSGRAEVHTGEIVTAKVDFAEINDLYLQTVYSFYEMGGEKVWDNTRCAFVFDHYAPCPDIKSASNHKEMREFARKNNLKFHFDTNCGVCHQVMPEAGVIYPGMIVVATDSHTTTHGAFGAMGTGCGATDMATILMTGELWFRVPEIIEVRLEGEAPKGVYPKDVVLAVLGKIRADGAEGFAGRQKGTNEDLCIGEFLTDVGDPVAVAPDEGVGLLRVAVVQTLQKDHICRIGVEGAVEGRPDLAENDAALVENEAFGQDAVRDERLGNGVAYEDRV